MFFLYKRIKSNCKILVFTEQSSGNCLKYSEKRIGCNSREFIFTCFQTVHLCKKVAFYTKQDSSATSFRHPTLSTVECSFPSESIDYAWKNQGSRFEGHEIEANSVISIPKKTQKKKKRALRAQAAQAGHVRSYDVAWYQSAASTSQQISPLFSP